MKALLLVFVSFAISLMVACEERGAGKTPELPKADAVPTESQLKETKEGLMEEISAEERQITELAQEIQDLKIALEERREYHELLEEEKKQIAIELKELKTRWEKETEGIGGHVDRPLHEIFRRMKELLDRALQENKELKQRLEAAEK